MAEGGDYFKYLKTSIFTLYFYEYLTNYKIPTYKYLSAEFWECFALFSAKREYYFSKVWWYSHSHFVCKFFPHPYLYSALCLSSLLSLFLSVVSWNLLIGLVIVSLVILSKDKICILLLYNFFLWHVLNSLFFNFLLLFKNIFKSIYYSDVRHLQLDFESLAHIVHIYHY